MKRLFHLISALGLMPALLYVGQRIRTRCLNLRAPYHLRTKEVRYPLLCRPVSSDVRVFHQVFIHREYAILDNTPAVQDPLGVKLLIDCGANVGYASALFLSRFPLSRLIAVEPDAANFALLQDNLAPYGSRARCIQSALWSHPAQVVMTENTSGRGQEWGRQVRECREGESSSLMTTSIPTLLRESGEPRISLLKIDIEGAEAVVFSGDCEWLDLVDQIVIELHDNTDFGNATEVFQSACAGRFDLIRSGELTVGMRAPRSRPGSR